MALAPTLFKLLPVEIAKDLAKQIVNRYLVLHGLPALGVGIVLTPTVKRVKNKIAQSQFRSTHQRHSVWKANDNESIVIAYEAKLQAVRVAKKNYLFKQRQLKAALYNYNRAVNSGSYLIGLQEIVNFRTDEKNAAHNIYIASQSLNYAGDGTTL